MIAGFLDSAVLLASARILSNIGIGAALLSISGTALTSFWALRAKKRAHDSIIGERHENLQLISRLENLIHSEIKYDIDREELEKLLSSLKKDIKTLPESDQKYVIRGLDQADKRSAIRYAADILGVR